MSSLSCLAGPSRDKMAPGRTKNMKNLGKKIFSVSIICFIYLFFSHTSISRDVHRPLGIRPRIVVYYTDDPEGKKYTLTNGSLEKWAIFDRYNEKLLRENQLPEVITYRNQPDKSVTRAELEDRLEKLVVEITKQRGKSKLEEQWIVLKDEDFNYAKKSGMLILKCKDYPFVIKFYRETPETFVRPYSKGIMPAFFFVMGGGINRFLTGFTRIPNLQVINKIIEQNEEWRDRISTPRKWFWTPQNVRSFTVVGYHLAAETLTTKYPSIYAIICDEIVKEREFTLGNKEDRKTGLALARLFNNRLDPHICNFLIEKNTGKITFIDTEHFPSVVGIKGKFEFNSYTSWYVQLGGKCLKNALFKTSWARLQEAEQTPESLII